MTAWSPKNCRSHWDQLDLHQEVVNQHSRSDLRMSSPSLHHQFQLHQPHGSSCRQTDRPTDMSIIAPTHVHLFSNWSGKPIYIKHTSLKTFDKIITQIPEIWKIVVPCNVKEIYVRRIKKKILRGSCLHRSESHISNWNICVTWTSLLQWIYHKVSVNE